MKAIRIDSTGRTGSPSLSGGLRARWARVLTRDGAPSIDGLDAAIRGFGVGIVVLLCLVGYGRPPDPGALAVTSPLLIAASIVAYNLLVISVLGVPWRHT